MSWSRLLFCDRHFAPLLLLVFVICNIVCIGNLHLNLGHSPFSKPRLWLQIRLQAPFWSLNEHVCKARAILLSKQQRGQASLSRVLELKPCLQKGSRLGLVTGKHFCLGGYFAFWREKKFVQYNRTGWHGRPSKTYSIVLLKKTLVQIQ